MSTSKPQIPEKMLAVQVVEFNKPYKIHEIPTPSSSNLTAHEILVKIGVASLCHTDSMVQSGIFKPASGLPLTASHEGAGIVVAAGPSSDLPVGTRVMVGIPKDRCGSCLSCRRPDPNERQYCPHIAGHVGVTIDGSFADYVVADSRQSVRVPDEVSLVKAAPLACAGTTIWRGVVQTGLKGGKEEEEGGNGPWIAIVGAGGGLGHLGVQFAKRAFGLRVVAIDARDEGLALAKEAGADVVLDAREGKEEIVKKVKEVVRKSSEESDQDLGVEVALNVSEGEGAAALACAITRMHGKMIQIAQPELVSVPFAELVFRNIHIEGSLVSSRGQAADMLQATADHKIEVRTNNVQGLHRVPELQELAHSGKMSGKGVCIVDESLL